MNRWDDGDLAYCIIQYTAHGGKKGMKALCCRVRDDGETKWNGGLSLTMALETWSSSAAAPLRRRGESVSDSEPFLWSTLQLANLQAAWIMHKRLAAVPVCSSTMNWHPSSKTDSGRSLVSIMAAQEEALLTILQQLVVAAESGLTCLINRSDQEVRRTSAAPP